MNRSSGPQDDRPLSEARTPKRDAGPERDPFSAREAGLELIRRINRWLVGAAVLAAGVLSLAAAHTFHGRTVKTSGQSSSSAPAQSPSSASGASGSPSSAGASGLQSPAQAPAPAPAAPAPVVSGGS